METSGNRTALGVTADIAQQVGARLRRARESIGRSTSALSAKIKVREHYLVAIEDGEWNELPPGLNGRGLIRIYARELSVAVPELDQAANQSVMPAEQDAQAPYQLSGPRKEGQWDREATTVRVAVENQSVTQMASRPVDTVVKTSTLNSSARTTRGTENPSSSTRMSAPSPIGHRIIESTPDEEPLDVVTPDVASILGISLDVLNEPAPQEKKRPLNMVSSQSALPREDHVLHANMIIPEATEESKKSRVEFTPPAEVVRPVEVAPQVEAAPMVEVVPQVEVAPQVEVVPQVEVAPQVEVVSQVIVNESQIAPQAVEPARSQNHQGNGKKNKKHGKGRHDRAERADDTLHQSQSSAQLVNEPVPATEFVHSESPNVEKLETVPVATEASSFAVETTSAATTVEINSQETVAAASAQSVGVSAAEQYLMNHAQSTAPATDATFGESQGQASSSGKALRIAVGLMAACVLILVGGKFMMRESGQSSQVDGTTTESSAVETSQSAPTGTTQEAGAPAKTDTTGAESNVQTTSPTEPVKTDAAASQRPEGAQTAATSTASQPAAAGKVDSAPAAQIATVNAQPATAASTAASPTVDDETAADTEEATPQKNATKPATTGATAAVLTVLEPIEIQVTADGQKIYSGLHQPGKVDIKFNKRAEIFVQDGSKARLKYSGWEHGAMGQAGRKRRIVLNADTFATGRP